MECERVKTLSFDSNQLVKMPDGSIRVPATIPKGLDPRCRIMLADNQKAFAWQKTSSEWKTEGSALKDLQFPGVSTTELKARLGRFEKPKCCLHEGLGLP